MANDELERLGARVAATEELLASLRRLEKELEQLRRVTPAPEELPAPPLEFEQAGPSREEFLRDLNTFLRPASEDLRGADQRLEIFLQRRPVPRITEIHEKTHKADEDLVSFIAGQTALPVALSSPIVPLVVAAAPIAVEVAKEVAPVVIREVAKGFGALAEFSAIFRGRERATNLARVWQSNGIPSFVYFDPVPFTPAPEERRLVAQVDPETGEVAEKLEVRHIPVPELDPETGRPKRGVWRVEVDDLPTEVKEEIIGARRALAVPPGERIPPDPRRRLFLEFPPAPMPVAVMSAIVERPTLLDAVVDSEFGAILVAGAAPQAPCDCAIIPEHTTPKGKFVAEKPLCTREGAVGILSQSQVRVNCSEIRPLANGRLRRAQALREAQAVCGTLVEGIADRGERFGARFTCLQEFLVGRGMS